MSFRKVRTRVLCLFNYRRRFVVASFVVLLLAGLPARLLAQGTGTIHGVVTDSTGAVIPAAKVTATLEERHTTRTIETGTEGIYVLPILPVGTYTIEVEVTGFKTFRQQGVTLTSNQNVRVDAQLEVGAATESVTVTGEAPLVDSRSSVMGSLIDSRRVLELPMSGRNVIGLAVLLPGASSVSAPQTFTGDRSGPTVAMSGSRANQNLLLFDGAHFNAHFRNTGLNYPPPDALQEVKVLTNGFSAEYGRNAGSVFNVVTRSGTNEIHGSAWEFLRNQKLNARNFFAPAEKPKLIQNQFGAAAGGPIRKDKLFIFGSYEGLRIRPASLSTSAFPLTQAERTGDFSGSAPIKDPTTGSPFEGNKIPDSRIDTVSRNLISKNMIPLPNQPGGQYVTVFPLPQDNEMFLVRLDYNRGKHTIDGRYNYNLAKQKDAPGNIPEYMPLDREAKVQSVTVGDTYSLRPNLLNQVRLGFNRIKSSIVNLNPTHITDLGGNFPLLGPKMPPSISISGRVSLGSGSSVDAIIVNESFQISDSIHWTRGEHTVKAGFELLKLRYLNRSAFLTMGTYSFTGTFTGNPAADFILGKAESMQVASPLLEQAGLQTNMFYFIQDDWKVHPRLTLNLGLRYELALPWVHPHDFWGTLRPGQQSQVIKTAPVGMVFPGDPGIPRGLIQTDKNNFGPRFGFAWDPFGKGRTSVRGAYGIFNETTNADIIQNTSQPYRYTFTINAPYALSDPLRGQPPVPPTVNLSDPDFVGVQQLFYPDPSLRTPYVQHFNLNVQQQVLPDLVVQVGYVGKLGRKLLMGVAANPAIYGPGATLGNINQRRILQPFGSNSKISSQATSSYHAMQLDVNKRFSRGFSVQGVYTYSKSIDIASAIALGAAVPNVFDLSTQKGPSDFHAKHIGSFSWIWELPRFTGSSAPLRHVAGGWQVNGLVTFRSGGVLNILAGRDVALSGTNNQRANVIGDHRLPGNRSREDKIRAWFDRAAFALPATGTYGNVGRNALIGPAAATTNLGAFKNFDLPGREGLRLQFRSEFFNLLNSVNLSNPNTQVTAGTRMGQITGAGSAREIQFALKLLF